MSASSHSQRVIDLEFMRDVDAAQRDNGKRWVYRFYGLVLLIVGAILIWACFSERNEVTRGNGQIIPSLGVQPIQATEGGIISEIFVKENQLVQKGQRLATISNVGAKADYAELANKQKEYDLAIKRLQAEEKSLELVFTEKDIAESSKGVADQQRLYIARKEQYEQEEYELAAILAQRKAELDETLERKKQYEQTLLILKQQEEMVRPLLQSRTYSEIDYLNLKQRIVSQEGELRSLAQSISKIYSAVSEMEAKRANHAPERQAAIATDMQMFRTERDSMLEKLKAGDQRVQNAELLAPMAGTIKRILLKEQSVAQRAEMVMELVPADDSLEVDARFRPADRGFLALNQNATIKVTAYDFAIYGGLDANIISISPDTIEDVKGEPWYNVRLRTKSSKLPFPEKDLHIEAGMTVTVDVLSGKKTVMSYLLKPVFKSKQRSNVVDLQDATKLK